jgi:hypothetical protein
MSESTKEERTLRKQRRIYRKALDCIRAGLFPAAMPEFMDNCDREELLLRIKRAYDEADKAIRKVDSDT